MKVALLLLAFFGSVAHAQPLPALQFAPPQGFTGSLGKDPSAHVSMNGDAMLNIYPFRRAGGAEQFRRTLLREVLTPDSQEARLAGAPEIQEVKVPGADAALFARFVEDRSGTRRYRLRVAVFSAGAVALVDYNANGPDSYQRNWPALSAVLDSLRVVAAGQAASAPPAQKEGAKAGAAGPVHGLYLASTRRFMPTIGGAPGSGTWHVATRFYLLSKDGRFHRGYGLPSVPGGDLQNFDFGKAEREDAPNTGTYSMKAGRVSFRSRNGDAAEGTVSSGELAVENMTFKKAALKR